MTREELEKVFEGDGDIDDMDRNIFRGLELISKYIPDCDIRGAEHDIVYCCSVDDLLKAGITLEDAEKLRNMNWMIIEDYLACFA